MQRCYAQHASIDSGSSTSFGAAWHNPRAPCGGMYDIKSCCNADPSPPPPPADALLLVKVLRVALSSVQPSHCRPPPPASPMLLVNFDDVITI